jgi:hypothetical protein
LLALVDDDDDDDDDIWIPLLMSMPPSPPRPSSFLMHLHPILSHRRQVSILSKRKVHAKLVFLFLPTVSSGGGGEQKGGGQREKGDKGGKGRTQGFDCEQNSNKLHTRRERRK